MIAEPPATTLKRAPAARRFRSATPAGPAKIECKFDVDAAAPTGKGRGAITTGGQPVT
ncbi:MAG: hypothetical protein Tsb0019_23470 [Roseibium sp.]